VPRWARYTLCGFFGAVVLANVVTGLLWERHTEKTPGQICLEHLRRTATALSVYAATHNWRYPQNLLEVPDPESHRPLDITCPVSGQSLGYLGERLGGFGWDAPDGVPLLWCTSPHVYISGGDKEILVVTTEGTGVRWDINSFSYFLKGLDDALKKRWDQVEMCRLALGGMMTSLRRLGWLLLAEAVKRDGLSDEAAKLLRSLAKQGHFEAACVLAASGDDAGAGVLVGTLKTPDFRRRMRAFLALKSLAGDTFGFRPEMPPDTQKEALHRWMRWLKTR